MQLYQRIQPGGDAVSEGACRPEGLAIDEDALQQVVPTPMVLMVLRCHGDRAAQHWWQSRSARIVRNTVWRRLWKALRSSSAPCQKNSVGKAWQPFYSHWSSQLSEHYQDRRLHRAQTAAIVSDRGW